MSEKLSLGIYQKPRRSRFKVYVVCGKRRLACLDQPYHGFKTMEEATEFYHTIDQETEFARFVDQKGSTIPSDEVAFRP